MRNSARVVVLIGLLLGTSAAQAAHRVHTRPRANVVTAKAAILIDNQTGEVLWQHNPDLPLPPASTTKIVTAMLALESGRLDDSLSVTPEAAEAPPSKISVRPGWKMRVRDLVYAVLLNSANDAAVVIAEGLSGSVRDFAERMNAKARALGATNTHFVNPNGLPAADHYSTARDLATMFGRGMQNPLFEKIVSTKTTEVWPAAGSTRRIALHNHNRLLGNYRIHVVGKTGWTIAAKKCFVGAATVDGREVVVAVLGSRDLWVDLKRLLEYGLDGGSLPAAEAETQASAPISGPSFGGDAEIDASLVYSVRLAPFRHLSNANRLRDSVAQHGFPARIEKLGWARHPRYRVAVGRYSNRRDAERTADEIKRTQRHLAIVVASN